MSLEYGEVSWERMIRAVENIRRRLVKATSQQPIQQAAQPH